MQLFAEGPSGAAARVQAVLKAAKGAVRVELLNATGEAAAAVLPMSSLPEAASPDKTRARPESVPVQVHTSILLQRHACICGCARKRRSHPHEP